MTNSYLNNPTVNDLCEAYLADRRNPHAERRCKNPDGLASHLKATRKLWGAMPIEEFRVKSRGRVQAACDEWRAAGFSPFTIRKRISILKTVFKFAREEETIERGQEPTIKLPRNGAPRERFVDPVKELPALLKAPIAPTHRRTFDFACTFRCARDNVRARLRR